MGDCIIVSLIFLHLGYFQRQRVIGRPRRRQRQLLRGEAKVRRRGIAGVVGARRGPLCDGRLRREGLQVRA